MSVSLQGAGERSHGRSPGSPFGDLSEPVELRKSAHGRFPTRVNAELGGSGSAVDAIDSLLPVVTFPTRFGRHHL